MTFSAPERLLLLAAPVALLVAYLFAQRSRQRAALRFTDVDLLASVAPSRPGWQRHVPAAALLAAIGVLALAIAGPQMNVRTPKQRATVILSLDTSASMTATDVSPSRLEAAQREARDFVDELPSGLQVGLVSFAASAQVLVAPTADRAAVRTAIDNLGVGAGTDTANGINASLEALNSIPAGDDGKPPPAAIVLMSDGTPTVGQGDLPPEQAVREAADRATAAGVPISTIAFGTPDGTVIVRGRLTPVPVDPDAMQRIAEATGGRSFTAETADQLESVYEEIGRDIGYVSEKRDVTAAFTAGALVIAVLAAIAALVWTQRMI